MANYFILMGDVVASRRVNARELQRHLKSLVSSCNSDLKSLILSPYTITLGDEFQGIATSLRAIIESIFYFEETCIKKRYHFKLHYVGHYGEIQTPINREIAYEMMGPGLTQARALKLGTRLHEEKQDEISNNYFLLGNLISIFLAMLYTIITKGLWTL